MVRGQRRLGPRNSCTYSAIFEEKEHGQTNGIYLIDGTPVEGNALHPVGLLATIAQGSLILDDACADEWLRRFFSTPLRSGPRRYYDNCLYLLRCLL